MEKKTYQFNTNINCEGCLSKVRPFLQDLQGLEQWEVDIQHPDKVLTIVASGLTKETVEETVKKAGFQAKEREG